MKIKLSNLVLDKENPRFIISKNSDTTEEEIFNYLKDNEVLDKLIESISRTGFFQIGEKPIVMQDTKNSQNYIVLEGNRRVCALKALHGFYSKKYDFLETLRQDSKEIDVDVVSSREAVQPFLAARHIQGIRLWEPEARRNFYYKHYINGKSLTYIGVVTQQKLPEIKKFIKELLFLDFFKKMSGYKDISTPSLIYERIQRYFVELELIKEIEVPEEFKDCKITINVDILSEKDLKEFCRLLADGIFAKENFIDSRSINKITDFKSLLQSPFIGAKQPRLKQLFDKIMETLERKKFVPNQMISAAVKGKIPPINEIINYSVIAEDVKLEIYFGDKLITEQEFIDGNPGNYVLKINEFVFNFKIIDFLKPIIQVIEGPFKNFKIGTTEDISKLINIYDVYGEKIDINNKAVSIKSNSQKLQITPNKNVYIEEAGTYSFEIKYSFDDNLDYTTVKTVLVEARAMDGLSSLSEYKGYFNFKYLNVNSVISSIVTGQLINELEDNYSRNNLYIFAAALRCVMELSLGDLLAQAQKTTACQRWKKAKDNADIIKIFKTLTSKDFNDIAKEFFKKRSCLKGNNYKHLGNYLGANIASTQTGHLLDPVIHTLHLGAHGTLRAANIMNLKQIQASFIAWLELIYIIIEIGCSI